MNKIIFSINSLNDLEKIKFYLEEELHNHLSGDKIVTKIIQSIEKIKVFPHLGKNLSSVVNFKTNYRYFICCNYYIFYYVEKNVIYIIRIIHCSRNYISILF